MFTKADLPEILPIFPLEGALLLPRARLSLNLFEPRYLEMLEVVLARKSRMFGMIQPATADTLHQIGCAGRVTAFEETGQGNYLITLTGVSRFRLLTEVSDENPYRSAQVRFDGFERDLGEPERDPGLDRPSFLDLLARFLDLGDRRTQWEELKDAEDELLINALSIFGPFQPEDKQALLEAPSLPTRRETLVALMEYELARIQGGPEERLQ